MTTCVATVLLSLDQEMPTTLLSSILHCRFGIGRHQKKITPTPLHSGQLQTICDSFNIISFCSNVPTLSRLSHCSSSLVHLVSSSCTTYGSLTEPECREVYANAKMAKTFLVPRYYKRQSHNVLHCSHLLSWSSLSLTHVPNVLNDSDFLFILYCPLVPNV